MPIRLCRGERLVCPILCVFYILQTLAYKRFQHVPLYLEWAPKDIFTSPATGTVQRPAEQPAAAATAAAAGQAVAAAAGTVGAGTADAGVKIRTHTHTHMHAHTHTHTRTHTHKLCSA